MFRTHPSSVQGCLQIFLLYMFHIFIFIYSSFTGILRGAKVIKLDSCDKHPRYCQDLNVLSRNVLKLLNRHISVE